MSNLVFHHGAVTREQREALLGHKGCVVWLTGLSGSGKSTIASALETRLVGQRRLAYVIDGDNVRHGLNSDLGFSSLDRQENIRRVGEVAALMADVGVITITSLISPFRAERDRVRDRVGERSFIEVHLDVPLQVCEERDPKGLYRRARDGEIPEFTGISSPYETPVHPAVRINTSDVSVADSVDKILDELLSREILPTK